MIGKTRTSTCEIFQLLKMFISRILTTMLDNSELTFGEERSAFSIRKRHLHCFFFNLKRHLGIVDSIERIQLPSNTREGRAAVMTTFESLLALCLTSRFQLTNLDPKNHQTLFGLLHWLRPTRSTKSAYDKKKKRSCACHSCLRAGRRLPIRTTRHNKHQDAPTPLYQRSIHS